MDAPDGLTLEYLVNLARKAGEIMVSNFKLGMTSEWKADETPLTATDTAINKLVVERITQDFPMVKVIGEEGSNGVAESKWVVLCDPVDGTSAFKTGIPTSCFCISLLNDGQPILACIYDPFQDRMYTATSGGGAHLNGKPIRVSSDTTLKRTYICVNWWKGCAYNMFAILSEVVEAGATSMAPLSIAYWAALVAAGELGATVFPSTKPWETAAIKLLIEEAGGRVTDIFGQTQERYDGEIRGHLASNGHLHDELTAITRRVNGL